MHLLGQKKSHTKCIGKTVCARLTLIIQSHHSFTQNKLISPQAKRFFYDLPRVNIKFPRAIVRKSLSQFNTQHSLHKKVNKLWSTYLLGFWIWSDHLLGFCNLSEYLHGYSVYYIKSKIYSESAFCFLWGKNLCMQLFFAQDSEKRTNLVHFLSRKSTMIPCDRRNLGEAIFMSNRSVNIKRYTLFYRQRFFPTQPGC